MRSSKWNESKRETHVDCEFVVLTFQDVVSREETGPSDSEHPDAEFEGMGDYEESFLAEWWQEPKTKWDTGEVAD